VRVAGQAGRLLTGTSGFAYPSWIPRFYEPGKASRKLLTAYAGRLPAVELNNTFYRRPPTETVERWRRETPASFRFCPKAQRSASWRAWKADAVEEAMTWLRDGLEPFGEQLGCVLLAAAGTQPRDDGALDRLLTARPEKLPLALSLPHPSWADDEVYAALAAHDVALVATDRDGEAEPDLRRSGPFLYLRLRRAGYGEDDLARWARRLEPFLADGLDAYVFFRHDDDGGSALQAERLLHLLDGSSLASPVRSYDAAEGTPRGRGETIEP
jgi:uncharacterized protein YecE (DUF72 family)